ncbi:MAG TPA: response regulator transcription factor [Puia sp.]|nr:response regulator transcription factor [Puia sp.]
MQPIKVCLVEDSREVREGMVSLLTLDQRFEVLAAYTDAETAADHLPGWQADIVVMDINLPGMSGIECIKKVKRQCPQSQFIMFTIYENDEKVFEALEAGANGYLLKKTPLAKITDSLVELYEGGAPMSTQIARKVIERMHIAEPAGEKNILSPREIEILELLARGLLYKEISDQLNITTGTVRQHIHRIYEKLHVQNRTEAINKAFGSK